MNINCLSVLPKKKMLRLAMGTHHLGHVTSHIYIPSLVLIGPPCLNNVDLTCILTKTENQVSNADIMKTQYYFNSVVLKHLKTYIKKSTKFKSYCSYSLPIFIPSGIDDVSSCTESIISLSELRYLHLVGKRGMITDMY